LILLDLMLPDLDGLSLCKVLRTQSETKEIPIVMLTAKDAESDMVAGLDSILELLDQKGLLIVLEIRLPMRTIIMRNIVKRIYSFSVLILLAVSPLRAQDQQELRSRLETLEQEVADLKRLLLKIEEKNAEQRPTEKKPEASQSKATTIPRPDPSSLRAYWKEGIRMDSADQSVKFKLGGRILNDWVAFSADDSVDRNFTPVGGTEFRAARLYMSGTLHDRVEFKAQYDFAPISTAFKDVWIGINKIPGLGKFRIGHFKEPFGLELMNSSRYITFMARALPTALMPSRNTGFLFTNPLAGQRMTWAAGVFKDTPDTAIGLGSENYSMTGRFTGLPLYQDEGRRLVHLGVAYSRRNPILDTLRLRARPETHLSNRWIDTRSFPARSEDLLGVEAALVQGPFSLQGEYVRAATDSPGLGDPSFNSFYVAGSLFLTGENRRYKRDTGTFTRVRPKGNLFGGEKGIGAWQLAARYSRLDLNHRTILGGKLNNLTLGLNWFLNPNTRIMFNYVLADRQDIGEANIFQTRFQVDF